MRHSIDHSGQSFSGLALSLVFFALLTVRALSSSSTLPIRFRSLDTGDSSSLSSSPFLPADTSATISRESLPATLLVQFRVIPTEATKRELGVALGPYVPERTFLVYADDESVVASLNASSAVSWFGILTSRSKVAPEVFSRRNTTTLVAFLLNGENVEEVALKWSLATGSSARAESATRIRLINASDAEEAAFWIAREVPRLFWVEPVMSVTAMNFIESGLIMTGDINDHSLWTAGLTGEGEIVAVADSGLDYDNCYFHDANFPVSFYPDPPNPQHRKVLWYVPSDPEDHQYRSDAAVSLEPGSGGGSFGHGTHVAGTIGGRLANSGESAEGGLAKDVKLVVFDIFGEDEKAVNIEPDMNMPQSKAAGARVLNNSWGCGLANTACYVYDWRCQAVDHFSRENDDFLLVFAAGNFGSRGAASVVSPCLAKNVLCVGAVDQTGLMVPVWSSQGPTLFDGRFKPDVIAPGQSVVSARSDGIVDSYNCDTVAKRGTSMSCPFITASSAIVRQYFNKGYYPSGTPVSADGFSPSASLVRAIIIASATPVGGSLDPDNKQGFGLPELDTVLYIPAAYFKLRVFHNISLKAFSEYQVCLLVKSKYKPLKATLVWTDPAGAPGTSKALVNDLDLQIWSHLPNSTVTYSNGLSASDRVNTVEKAVIGVPQRGFYSVIVRAYQLSVGLQQSFSLVITGHTELSSVCPTLPSTYIPRRIDINPLAYPLATTQLPLSLVVPPPDGPTEVPDPVVSTSVGQSSSSNTLTILIGAAAGGVVAVLVLSAVIVYVVVKRRIERNTNRGSLLLQASDPESPSQQQRIFLSDSVFSSPSNTRVARNIVVPMESAVDPQTTRVLVPPIRAALMGNNNRTATVHGNTRFNESTILRHQAPPDQSSMSSPTYVSMMSPHPSEARSSPAFTDPSPLPPNPLRNRDTVASRRSVLSRFSMSPPPGWEKAMSARTSRDSPFVPDYESQSSRDEDLTPIPIRRREPVRNISESAPTLPESETPVSIRNNTNTIINNNNNKNNISSPTSSHRSSSGPSSPLHDKESHIPPAQSFIDDTPTQQLQYRSQIMSLLPNGDSPIPYRSQIVSPISDGGSPTPYRSQILSPISHRDSPGPYRPQILSPISHRDSPGPYRSQIVSPVLNGDGPYRSPFGLLNNGSGGNSLGLSVFRGDVTPSPAQSEAVQSDRLVTEPADIENDYDYDGRQSRESSLQRASSGTMSEFLIDSELRNMENEHELGVAAVDKELENILEGHRGDDFGNDDTVGPPGEAYSPISSSDQAVADSGHGHTTNANDNNLNINVLTHRRNSVGSSNSGAGRIESLVRRPFSARPQSNSSTIPSRRSSLPLVPSGQSHLLNEPLSPSGTDIIAGMGGRGNSSSKPNPNLQDHKLHMRDESHNASSDSLDRVVV